MKQLLLILLLAFGSQLNAQYSNHSLKFSSSGSLKVPGNDTANLSAGSWGAWVKFDTLAGPYQRIIYKEAKIELFYYQPLNRIEAEINTSGGFRELGSDSSTHKLQPNTWYFLMATFDSTKFNLYINGELADSMSVTSSTITSNNGMWGIGSAPNSGAWRFQGNIDNVMLFDRALDSNEVVSLICDSLDNGNILYNDLVAFYKFDEGNDTLTFDEITGDSAYFFNTPQWYTPGHPVVEKPIVSAYIDTLTVYQGGGSYQWFMNNSNILGADSNMYITTANGMYHVEYTNEMGCKVNSDTLNFTTTGTIFGSENTLPNIKMFPNPSHGTLNIQISSAGNYFLRVINPLGQIVIENQVLLMGANDISLTEKGVYQLQILNKQSGDSYSRSVINY